MSVFIIAEAGVNHNGSIALAKKLIDAAAISGANAVKFQTFKTEKLVSKISESLDQSGKKSGFVIHGRIKGNATIQGIDELSSCGENIVQGFGQNSSTKKTIWDVEKFGCNPAPIEHIAGGDLSENLRIMERLLDGSASTGLTDSILMNASLAFLTTGRTKHLEEGVDLAKKLLKDGTVKTWLAEVTTFFK